MSLLTRHHDTDGEPTVAIRRDRFAPRRRAGRRRTLWRVLGLGLVVAVAAGAVYVVWFSSLLTARRTVVTGTSYLNPVQVRAAAQVPADTPLARVDLAAIQARIDALAPVRSVRVSRSWPHEVRIAVTERTAVAVVPAKKGFRGLAADGVLFRSYDARPPGLPVIQEQGATVRALQEAADVVGSLPPQILAKVDHVSVRTVDQIELDMRSGRLVVWGSAAGSAQKAQVLEALLPRKSAVIDVSVPGRPTTR